MTKRQLARKIADELYDYDFIQTLYEYHDEQMRQIENSIIHVLDGFTVIQGQLVEEERL